MFQREYASLEGPEPKQVDVPQRRSSLNTRPGNSALIDAPNIVPTNFEDSPLPLSQQELAKQESEAELLASVGGLSAVSGITLCYVDSETEVGNDSHAPRATN